MMRKKTIFLLLSICALLGASKYTTGMIFAVDIHAKTIQIGQQTYGIVDGIKVYSQSNQLQSQRALAPNQRVEYALAPQPLDMKQNPSIPSQVVTDIRILSGFKEDNSKD